MQDIKFLPDTREQDIVTALLSGQRKMYIDGVEIILKPLKRDTRFSKEREAKKFAKGIISIL